MTLSTRAIESIAEDVASLRTALTERAHLSDQAALAMVTTAMPAIVTHEVDEDAAWRARQDSLRHPVRETDTPLG